VLRLTGSWEALSPVIQTPGRWRVAGVAFGIRKPKTTGRVGQKNGPNRDDWLRSLDPGVAPYVDVLDAAGIETFESCEGGEGHAMPEPTIRFHGQRPEGFRALAVARTHDLLVSELRREWPLIDREPTGPYWALVFYLPSLSRR
jgi:hypothetical protein